MGRSIPSITYRLDTRIRRWDRLSRLLSMSEQRAYRKLVSVARNRRTAIAEADEPDLGVAILLAMAIYMEDQYVQDRNPSEEKHQDRGRQAGRAH